MIYIALLTMGLSLYVMLESMTVAKDDVVAKRFCIAARYVLCALAGLIGIHESGCYIINYLTPIKLASTMDFQMFILELAIALSCWSRMVFRIFGNRRHVA